MSRGCGPEGKALKSALEFYPLFLGDCIAHQRVRFPGAVHPIIAVAQQVAPRRIYKRTPIQPDTVATIVLHRHITHDQRGMSRCHNTVKTALYGDILNRDPTSRVDVHHDCRVVLGVKHGARLSLDGEIIPS